MFTIRNREVRNINHPAWKWNAYNKVFQDHRDGTIDHTMTNLCRDVRGLKTPWTPEMGDIDVRQPPVY